MRSTVGGGPPTHHVAAETEGVVLLGDAAHACVDFPCPPLTRSGCRLSAVTAQTKRSGTPSRSTAIWPPSPTARGQPPSSSSSPSTAGGPRPSTRRCIGYRRCIPSQRDESSIGVGAALPGLVRCLSGPAHAPRRDGGGAPKIRLKRCQRSLNPLATAKTPSPRMTAAC